MSNHPHWPLYAGVAVIVALLLSAGLRPGLSLAPLVALAALGWSLTLEQLLLIVRSPLEWGGAIVLLAVTLGAASAALARLAGRPVAAPREAGVTLLLGVIAAILALWLLFDPRYRDFFTAALAAPALLLFLLNRVPTPVAGSGRQELALGLLLLASVIAIAINETVQNTQALAWSAALLLLGGALAWRGREALSAARRAVPR